MNRTVLSVPIVHCLSLILFFVVFIPAAAQGQSRMIVRPALVPDSLVEKLAAKIVDTARVHRNWNKLKKGQTEAEVRKLLGLPAMVHNDGINGWTVWWYGKRSVAFNSVTRRLSHWDKILDL